MKQLTNYHALQVSFIGPSNHFGARVKIKSDRFEQYITIPFDYEFDTRGTAINHLNKLGFNLIGQAELKDRYLFISDTFQPLK
jgi:hypothetical protein